PKTQGVVSAIKQTRFAIDLARHGKVPPPVPPHVAENVDEARRLYDLVKLQGRDGAAGIVQGERAIARYERHDDAHHAPAGESGCAASPTTAAAWLRSRRRSSTPRRRRSRRRSGSSSCRWRR